VLGVRRDLAARSGEGTERVGDHATQNGEPAAKTAHLRSLNFGGAATILDNFVGNAAIRVGCFIDSRDRPGIVSCPLERIAGFDAILRRARITLLALSGTDLYPI